MLDDQFIHMFKHMGYGISVMLGKSLYWLINEVNKLIHTQKQALKRVKPRATCEGEPEIIWMKMLERPEYRDVKIGMI